MKILIIAIPRSGSTSLLFDTAKKYNLTPIFEPFRKDLNLKYSKFNSKYKKDMDNIVVKTMVYQHTNNIELSQNFDITILLSRKDLVSCAESLAYLTKNNKLGYELDKKYYYENITDEEFLINYEATKMYDSQINELSKILQIPIIYYEDIYNIDNESRLRKFHKNELKKII